MVIDFTSYYYFPCLQLSENEQIGYEKLSDEDKNSIIPIFELSQIKNESSFEDSVKSISDMIEGRPFIFDLSKDRAPPAYVAKNNPDEAKIVKTQAAQDNYNKILTSLLSPENGFAEWRGLVQKFPNSIPVLQFTDPIAQTNQILRQAALLSRDGYSYLSIRITEETNTGIFPVIGQIISILDSASQLLLIIDCGQGRQRIAERAEFAKLAIARIQEELEPSQALLLTAVCLHDSYTSPPDGLPKIYESHSWDLWSQASEKFPFLFGDYGANYRHKKTSTFMPGEWKAQVVYPMQESWLVYKHPDAQDVQGWINGSQAILKDPNCDKNNQCWGSELLERARQNDIEGVASARFWHGAKINMHIHRQIRYAPTKMGGGEP
ncbi:hypothetical protein [Stappia sp. 28M-7]|uniref:beta family protein n=1 Tax=Stappia sp. 28M-7 TaxID=2762596 RepID=UPI00163C9518|nr:hypothetical protein [Stappia sp. 28M-7]MBC2861589.1 hypothetical protein [Stappia sp. 28M-7]